LIYGISGERYFLDYDTASAYGSSNYFVSEMQLFW
jgi:hypothetical protein